jgi:ADP-ribose pyrophosphatase YjhB (NUDIX family)
VTSVPEPAHDPAGVPEALSTGREGGVKVHVGCIWQQGDALVLVRRGHGPAGGSWALPGDEVREGETLAEAVVRSIAEQTGADALCGPFVGWGEVVDDGPHVLTMYFEGVVLDAPAHDRASGTIADAPGEARVTPVWEVTEVPLVAGLAEFLADQELIELVI